MVLSLRCLASFERDRSLLDSMLELPFTPLQFEPPFTAGLFNLPLVDEAVFKLSEDFVLSATKKAHLG